LIGENSITAAEALRCHQELYHIARRGDGLEERLTLLEEEREVRDHITAYSVHYDARDLDRVVALFADDAVLHNILGRYVGASEIRKAFEFLMYHLGESMHFLSNLTVRIESPGQASASCYLDSIATRRVDGYGYGTCGTYTDRLVRTEQGWKITERRGSALIPYDLALTPASYDRFQASRDNMPEGQRQP
jgi:ketosteroid isomerase-like protein